MWFRKKIRAEPVTIRLSVNDAYENISDLGSFSDFSNFRDFALFLKAKNKKHTLQI